MVRSLRVHLATAGFADEPQSDTTPSQEGFDASLGVHDADCATVGALGPALEEPNGFLSGGKCDPAV